jgi:hypothetical protein
MPKQTGLAFTTLSVDDSGGVVRDIRNDITSFDFATPRDVQETTGIDKSAMERLLLLADFSINLNGIFNPDVNLSHDVFKTVPSTSVQRTVSLGVGGKTLANEVLFTDYSLTRGEKGELTWKAPGVLGNGVVPTWA